MNLNILLASTSQITQSSYLKYLKKHIQELFKETDEILFIPLARPGGMSYSNYTKKANAFFHTIDKDCASVMEYEHPQEAIKQAKGIFTGGGNTFLLLKKLYELNLFNPLKEKIENGCPYLGTSAGSNICGLNIKTTNDMPIVYPPSFEALGIIPYVINPHFIDKQKGEKHQGESRTTRLKEYLNQNETPVVALPEGTWIRIHQNESRIQGDQKALLFTTDAIKEIQPGINLDSLLK